MHLVAIANLKAGSRRLPRLFKHLRVRLARYGACEEGQTLFPSEAVFYHAVFPNREGHTPESFTILRTRKAGDASDFAQLAAKTYGAKALLVACGGDGTMNSIVQGMGDYGAALMVLPYGTGNDFARSIYPKHHRRAEKILALFGLFASEGESPEEKLVWPAVEYRKVDLIEFQADDGLTRRLANVLSIGVDSRVGEYASKLVRRFPFVHKLAYVFAVLPAICQPMTLRLRCSLKGMEWAKPEGPKPYHSIEAHQLLEFESDYTLSGLCNGAYYGGGFQPDPCGDYTDGVLEYALSRPVGRIEVAKYLSHYRRGSAHKKGLFRMFSTTEGRIESLDEAPLCITYDGEILHSRYIDYRVLPSALRLVLPKQEV